MYDNEGKEGYVISAEPCAHVGINEVHIWQKDGAVHGVGGEDVGKEATEGPPKIYVVGGGAGVICGTSED